MIHFLNILKVTEDQHKAIYNIMEEFMNFKVKVYPINAAPSLERNAKISINLMLGNIDLFVKYNELVSFYRSLLPFGKLSYRLILAAPPQKTVSPSYFILLFHSHLWLAILLMHIILIGFLIAYKQLHKLNVNQCWDTIFHVIGISFERIPFDF